MQLCLLRNFLLIHRHTQLCLLSNFHALFFFISFDGLEWNALEWSGAYCTSLTRSNESNDGTHCKTIGLFMIKAFLGFHSSLLSHIHFENSCISDFKFQNSYFHTFYYFTLSHSCAFVCSPVYTFTIGHLHLHFGRHLHSYTISWGDSNLWC